MDGLSEFKEAAEQGGRDEWHVAGNYEIPGGVSEFESRGDARYLVGRACCENLGETV